MHVEQQEQQDENESLATQHSAEEDNRNYIEISEKPINIYGTQWIIKKGRIGTHIFEKLFNTKKRHTWVVKDKLTEEKSKEILRKIHSESIIGVKIDNIDDWNMFQNTYLTFINQDLKVKLLKCNTLLEDVRSRAEMQEKILKEHLKNNHRGISCVYQTMKRKFYIPNLEHLITETINQCETCKLAKYERNPVKLPFKETETCNGPREIFSMDIWMPTTGVNYVSCIDRFSKYATLIKIKDRSWLSAKEAMFQVINIMGKPKKLIVDQDACLTAECFKNFLTKEKVKVHIVSSKTGLADIERFHGTMNEHIRILRIKEDKENIDEVVEALKYYNHTLHSTTGQRPIDLHLQDEKETKNKVNKSKWAEYRNNKENRKDVEIDERYVKDKNKKLGRKYRRVDVKDDCILSILKNVNGTCSFVKSSNRLIESINENMIITQNLQATKIYHNCNNRYKENILGSKVIKFFNCTVEISDFKFEGIPHYKNFMIHIQNNNMTTEIQFVEIDSKKQIVEHINEIKEIKLQNQINSRLNFSTITIIITICIITFCYMYVKCQKNKTKIIVKTGSSVEYQPTAFKRTPTPDSFKRVVFPPMDNPIKNSTF
ncbi:unnamed protein product [Hermetia illucens]|uniref:RNA-directed DNA polymerase n=1 Tax=Hermetia illucens TaxID=343691 RepID=A0A7R8V6K7_HERIL|nr:unnamed protein product [Hermetia illucens]